MKNKCVRCGGEASEYSVVCYDCKTRSERLEMILVYSVVVEIFAVIVGIRIAWAVYVFDDWRCAASECRIIKD